MISRYSLIKIIVRVSLILCNCFLLGFLYYNSENYVIIAHLFLLVFIQTWFLGIFLNRTNKRVYELLESYSNNDPVNISKIEKKDSYSRKIFKRLEDLNKKVRNAEIDLTKQLVFNKAITQNIPGGLIVLSSKKIELYSKFILSLLNKKSIQSTQDFSDLPELKTTIENIKAGERQVVKILVDNNIMVLSLSCSEMKIGNSTSKIISFENIKPELDANEILSYQKLIRVLNHEIMNTISPLVSANETLKSLIQHLDISEGKEITESDLKKIQKLEKGIQLINDRTKGLSYFIEKYRKLTRLPKPRFKNVLVKELFQELIALNESIINKQGIQYISEIKPEDLQLKIDKDLIMQVLINLFKNSIEALEHANNGQIVISASVNNDNRTVLSIKDNGCGVSEENINEIFIPFFTTKKEGSGIGLSLSKQIMHLHKGEISLKKRDFETEFELVF